MSLLAPAPRRSRSHLQYSRWYTSPGARIETTRSRLCDHCTAWSLSVWALPSGRATFNCSPLGQRACPGRGVACRRRLSAYPAAIAAGRRHLCAHPGGARRAACPRSGGQSAAWQAAAWASRVLCPRHLSAYPAGIATGCWMLQGLRPLQGRRLPAASRPTGRSGSQMTRFRLHLPIWLCRVPSLCRTADYCRSCASLPVQAYR